MPSLQRGSNGAADWNSKKTNVRLIAAFEYCDVGLLRPAVVKNLHDC